MPYLSKTELVTSLQSVIFLDRVLSSSWSSTWSGPGSEVGQVGSQLESSWSGPGLGAQHHCYPPVSPSFPTRVLDLSVMEMELLINSNPRIDINDLDGLNNDKLMHFYFVGIQSFKTDLTPWNDMTYCLTSGFLFTYNRNNLLLKYSKKKLAKLLRNYIMPYFTRLT